MIDIDEYKKCMYNTSHIGDVWLKRNDDSTQNTMTSSHPDDDDHVYKISVLIPIRTGPPKVATLAILSIMNECVMDESVMPMQIVIVDDRCNDGSIDAMMEEANMFGIAKGFNTKVFDWRYNEVEESISPFKPNNEKCIHIYLCKCFKPGLGAALNHGLTYCKSEFVARMDADDISCPFRLCRQLSILKKDLQTHVIGTNMVIFSDRKLSSSNAIDFHGSLVLPHDLTRRHGILSTSIQPSDAGFVDWTMMFSCILSHPTVMFRKRFIQNNGGYMEESCVTEDYELWLRLQKRQAKCMKSLPMIGLCHRKHTSRSNSDMRKVQQRNESIKLSHDIMMECLDPTTNEYSIHHVHVLKFPKDVTDLDTLNQSVEMLVQLEKAFLQKRKDTLTPIEISLIRHDCTERIGELATIGIQKFGRDASEGFAWYAWSDRDPNRQLERVTLLLSCT
jgi:glycosyltransferase involved in cell wall biosynthesis